MKTLKEIWEELGKPRSGFMVNVTEKQIPEGVREIVFASTDGEVFVGKSTLGTFIPYHGFDKCSLHINPDNCQHFNFAASVNVHRLAEKEGEPITHYSADIEIKCVDCGRPFAFMCKNVGLYWDKPAKSTDGLELRVPIYPMGDEEPTEEGWAGAKDLKILHLVKNGKKF